MVIQSICGRSRNESGLVICKSELRNVIICWGHVFLTKTDPKFARKKRSISLLERDRVARCELKKDRVEKIRSRDVTSREIKSRDMSSEMIKSTGVSSREIKSRDVSSKKIGLEIRFKSSSHQISIFVAHIIDTIGAIYDTICSAHIGIIDTIGTIYRKHWNAEII
ncbi:hypothetical protein LOAG_13499 [Loa loa]|uniref:Uncharacterized protein n=1 Tax=Loa loa TaxID=7209 RepID=A0A1S0TKR5_LOALO|nr:hypothetical protein LOAG_13499 [Loa loa]EFO15016.1 hypothetical protein LOAG_13499 [Loa loa]